MRVTDRGAACGKAPVPRPPLADSSRLKRPLHALPVLAALALAGCAALLAPIVQPGLDAYEDAYKLVETTREVSMEVLAAIPDDAPCRAEWRRLAADATDAMQRAESIYKTEVESAVARSIGYGSLGLEAGVRAQGRARQILLGRIALALDETIGCVQRGGLTMEEWVEMEARGQRPDPDAINPTQQDAIGRLSRPVA